MEIDARLVDSTRSLEISQHIRFINTEKRELVSIYLNDWNNAFSSKNSALARRFAEDYKRRFHFAKDHERGHTYIHEVTDSQGDSLNWDRPGDIVDLLRINLEQPLQPGDSIDLNFHYTVRVPEDNFTRFGMDRDHNYKLRYWYLVPAPLDNGWKLYSHQDLGLQYVQPYNIRIKLDIPTEFYAASSLNLDRTKTQKGCKTLSFSGSERLESKMYITKTYIFESLAINDKQIITNIEDEDIEFNMKSGAHKGFEFPGRKPGNLSA